MLIPIRCAVAVVSLILLTALSAQAADFRNANRIGVEVLGKGFLGSLFYERQILERSELGIGLGFFPGEIGDSKSSLMAPIYYNWNLSEDHKGMYLFAGTNLILASSSGSANGKLANFLMTKLVPIWGGGYEHISQSGFLFRVGLSFFLIIPMPGITLGATF